MGLSIYHYGNSYPYGSNDVPPATKYENILTGTNGFGTFNFYEMYSGNGTGQNQSVGGKPFFLAETGSAVFTEIQRPNGSWFQGTNTDGARRAAMR